MTRRLARSVVSLYPLAFRRRYGHEMRALLDEAPATWATVFDLLRGALAAHLHQPAISAGAVDVGDRLRASVSGVLACWVVFAAAGFGFYKTTEDGPFTAAGHAHPLLGGAHLAVQALAVVASLAVVLGALPLIAGALAHARHERSLRVLVSLPILAVVVFAALTVGLVLLAHSQHSHQPTAVGRGAFMAWGLAGLACALVCVVASKKALFAAPIARGRLLAALACGTLVTAAMAAIALATAVYTTALVLDASRLAAIDNGPTGATSTSFSLTAQIVVMILAGTLAAITTRRGWRAIDSGVSGPRVERQGG